MVRQLLRDRAACSLLIFIALIFGGCSTDDPGEDQYYISFKADLTRIVFIDQPDLTANFSESGNQHGCTINGSDRTSNITIQILDDSSITTGTYSGYETLGGVNIGVLMRYQDDNNDVFEQDSGNRDAIVTITAITATSVAGVFSGTVKTTTSAIEIKEGEFFVRRIN